MARTAAERQRTYRRRRRDGRAVYRVVGSERLLLALMDARRLRDEEADHRERVEQELTLLLEEWARRGRA